MKFSRDSLLWTLGIAGALLTYLIADGRNPLTWDYLSAIKFFAAVVATLAAKLSTSPLDNKATLRMAHPHKTIVMLALAVGLAGALGCATNQPSATDPTVNLSSTGKAAYQSLTVIKSLDLLRDITAEAEKQTPKLVSAKTALQVIAYHKRVVTTIGAVPAGWKAVALTGLDELKTSIPAAEWARIEPFVTLLKVLVDQFVPGGIPPDQAEIAATLAIDDALMLGLQ